MIEVGGVFGTFERFDQSNVVVSVACLSFFVYWRRIFLN